MTDESQRGSPDSPFARMRARDLVGWSVLAAVVAAFALPVVARTMHVKPDERVFLLVLTLAMALPLPLLARRAGLRWRRVFGPAPSRAELSLATIVVPVALVTMASALLVYVPLSYVAPRFVTRVLLDNDVFDVHTLWQWGLVMVAGVLVAPALEEMLFRGVLMQRWSHRWGTRAGVIASSALFAVLHGEWIGHFLFGVAMSLLYLRTRKLRVSIAAHALNNFVLIAPSLRGVLLHDAAQRETLDELRRQIWMAAPVLVAAAATWWLYRRYVWGEVSVRALLAGETPYVAAEERVNP